MDEIKTSIDALTERCANLEGLDLSSAQAMTDSIQEFYLDLLNVEPKKSDKAKHKLWAVQFKRLNALVQRVEAKENELYEAKFPKLKHYGELVEQPHSEREWVQLKREIDHWLASSSPMMVEEFDAQGYMELLESACQGLSLEEPEPEPSTDIYKYSPVPCFMKYLPLIYSVDELWDSFQLYVRSEFSGQNENFFAFHREVNAMNIWQKVIEDNGGGIPVSIFAAGAYLVLRYKELGHDIDAELQALYE